MKATSELGRVRNIADWAVWIICVIPMVLGGLVSTRCRDSVMMIMDG